MLHPLRQYRDKEGLSQQELADKLGVSRQMVGLVEIGERRIAAEDVLEWERKTGIPRTVLRPDIFGKAVA